MSLEKIIEMLTSLGLSRMDAEIYVFTAKKGLLTISQLSNYLLFSKKQISSSLKRLEDKELITKNKSGFFALPFDEALEQLIKNQRQEEKLLSEIKKIVTKKR